MCGPRRRAPIGRGRNINYTSAEVINGPRSRDEALFVNPEMRPAWKRRLREPERPAEAWGRPGAPGRASRLAASGRPVHPTPPSRGESLAEPPAGVTPPGHRLHHPPCFSHPPLTHRAGSWRRSSETRGLRAAERLPPTRPRAGLGAHIGAPGARGEAERSI